ncbi:MAG: hypothetical protein WAN51_10120, partial [Alphaproteobacteria bacterium]
MATRTKLDHETPRAPTELKTVDAKARKDAGSLRLHSAATDLGVARRVLSVEADALKKLGAALDEKFVRALDKLSSAPGRVIVTGMGKSGHIARKIAATLA